MEYQALAQLVQELVEKVQSLEQKINEQSFLQDDFSDMTIIRRKVQFLNAVYDSSGTKVIN